MSMHKSVQFVEMSAALKSRIEKLVDQKYPRAALDVVVVPFGEGARVTVFKMMGTGIYPVATAGVHTFDGTVEEIVQKLWGKILERSKGTIKDVLKLALVVK